MKKNERYEIVLHGARWANNILVEIVGNHSTYLPEEVRVLLRDATSLIAQAQDEIRKFQREGESENKNG